MTAWRNASDFKVVRLRAELFPIDEFEGVGLYEKYGLDPVQVTVDTPEEIIPCVVDCDGVVSIGSPLPREVIESMTRCRVISRPGAGVDKIDVQAATERGIVVAYSPGYGPEELADHAMALLLALARKIPQMSEAMAEGAWTKSRELAGTNPRLADCVLGLVGFGRSARAVANRARAFGMRVLATRRHMAAPSAEAVELGVEMVDLDTLLVESDFVSLLLPLSKDTYHMFDEAMLYKMKPGAYLINIARGAIVDEIALAEVLRTGRLAGAGLDVFEQINPFVGHDCRPEHSLLELDSVILTPHVAGLSVKSKHALGKQGMENLVAVLSGHWPQPGNIVNPKVVPRYPLADHDELLFKE